MWWRQKLRFLRRDTGAVAAIEFAAAAMLLVVGVLNAIDFGYYIYQRMEVENAAEVGAQAAWKTCYDQSSMLPATENCPGLDAAITTATQSTSLGTAVSLAAGYPTEGYYCVNASGALQLVAAPPSTEPANCSAVGNSSISPGDYIQVGVTYNYAPLFAISVMGASDIRSITMTSWMRLG
jgi:Flp pilus assembly protein TadG